MSVKESYDYKKTFYQSAYLSCPLVPYDSMEIAIKEYCRNKFKIAKSTIKKEYPFTAETKMSGILWANGLLCIKGAYESILPLCELEEKTATLIEKKIINYSQSGYRILAIAKTIIKNNIPEEISSVKYQFEGLIVLCDQPRWGVKKSIETCNNAGIRVLMITGDNGETAKGIAKQLNIVNCNEVLTGNQIENMSDDELFEKVKSINLYARVYPNHKMRIVQALQRDNKIVGMTGDGVNDAPALKKANIGIAMGDRGTNVAKESADLILLDDNFNTIVKAIKNGRSIYENIKRAISYILVIHIPVALLSLFVPIFKLPTLLLPVHIMLLELLIDPTSSILFQRIKPEAKIMNVEPRNTRESIINKRNIFKCIFQGLYMFLIIFISYFWLINMNFSYNLAITITYASLVLSIILSAFQLKSDTLTIKTILLDLKDKVSVSINLFVILGLCILVYVPFFNNIANTSPLKITDWLYVVLLSIMAVIPFDILKGLNKKE